MTEDLRLSKFRFNLRGLWCPGVLKCKVAGTIPVEGERHTYGILDWSVVNDQADPSGSKRDDHPGKFWRTSHQFIDPCCTKTKT